jgi:hypothetical protein
VTGGESAHPLLLVVASVRIEESLIAHASYPPTSVIVDRRAVDESVGQRSSGPT